MQHHHLNDWVDPRSLRTMGFELTEASSSMRGGVPVPSSARGAIEAWPGAGLAAASARPSLAALDSHTRGSVGVQAAATPNWFTTVAPELPAGTTVVAESPSLPKPAVPSSTATLWEAAISARPRDSHVGNSAAGESRSASSAVSEAFSAPATTTLAIGSLRKKDVKPNMSEATASNPPTSSTAQLPAAETSQRGEVFASHTAGLAGSATSAATANVRSSQIHRPPSVALDFPEFSRPLTPHLDERQRFGVAAAPVDDPGTAPSAPSPSPHLQGETRLPAPRSPHTTPQPTTSTSAASSVHAAPLRATALTSDIPQPSQLDASLDALDNDAATVTKQLPSHKTSSRPPSVTSEIHSQRVESQVPEFSAASHPERAAAAQPLFPSSRHTDDLSLLRKAADGSPADKNGPASPASNRTRTTSSKSKLAPLSHLDRARDEQRAHVLAESLRAATSKIDTLNRTLAELVAAHEVIASEEIRLRAEAAAAEAERDDVRRQSEVLQRQLDESLQQLTRELDEKRSRLAALRSNNENMRRQLQFATAAVSVSAGTPITPSPLSASTVGRRAVNGSVSALYSVGGGSDGRDEHESRAE